MIVERDPSLQKADSDSLRANFYPVVASDHLSADGSSSLKMADLVMFSYLISVSATC